MNTAEKLVEKATKKAAKKNTRTKTAKDYKKARAAVDIANPVTTGLEVTLGPGAVRKMHEFDRLRVEKDRIEAEMEAIKLYFAKQAGTAEKAIIGKSGKALFRGIKHIKGYTVDPKDIRNCTIAKASADHK